MAFGSGGDEGGGGWQKVVREKERSKREASSERPEMSEDEGNKVRTTGSTEELVMLLKLRELIRVMQDSEQ